MATKTGAAAAQSNIGSKDLAACQGGPAMGFLYRAMSFVAAVFFVAVLLGGPVQAGVKKEVDGFGPVLEGDPEGRASRAAEHAASGTCNVAAALAEMLQGNAEKVGSLFDSASKDYDKAADELEILLNEGGFQDELSGSSKSLLNLTGLFSERPVKQADILRRIAVLSREAETVAKRIADGSDNEADLMIVVQNSSNISRLIAVFFRAVLET